MRITEKIINKMGCNIAGKDVLEVACGRADLSIAMSQYAHTVKCIDLVDFRLNPSINRCVNVEFAVMDAANMTYEDNTFDIVVIYNSAYHIESEFTKIFFECMRVVKGCGAVYLLSTFSIDKPVIANTVIPLLKKADAQFEVEIDKNLVSVIVYK